MTKYKPKIKEINSNCLMFNKKEKKGCKYFKNGKCLSYLEYLNCKNYIEKENKKEIKICIVDKTENLLYIQSDLIDNNVTGITYCLLLGTYKIQNINKPNFILNKIPYFIFYELSSNQLDLPKIINLEFKKMINNEKE